jgi:membrane-associated phospholipid phosphatase
MLQFITDFGDTALLLPAALLVLGYLVYLRARASVVAWVGAFTACGAMTALLKVGFMACGERIPSLNVYTPSGHTSVATTFYVAMGMLISRNKSPSLGLTLIGGAAGLAAAIAVSRVLLEAHTGGEVLIGLFIGVVCVTWFATKYYGTPQPALPITPALGLLVVLALFAHGQRLSQESWLKAVAHYLRAHYGICS